MLIKLGQISAYKAVFIDKSILFLEKLYSHLSRILKILVVFSYMMDTIKKVRRVETRRVDNEECPMLLSDYLENIVGDLYMTVNEFEGENYIHIRRFYTDREGNLRPRKDGGSFTISQIPLLLETMRHLESRYWALEEGLPLKPYECFVGPWKLSVEIFGNINVFKHYYDPVSGQLMPTKKGISFLLMHYRPMSREISNLLERFPILKSIVACNKSVHSPLAKCDICDPF